MKRIVPTVFLLLFLLAGCGIPSDLPSTQSPAIPETISPESVETPLRTPGGMATPENPTDTPSSATVLPTQGIADVREIILFLPNDSVDGFVEERENVKVEPQSVVDALISRGALPNGVKVHEFQLAEEGKHILLDISREFEIALCSTGTSGEAMLIGTLVNTMLRCWGADTLSFTCEGRIVESGHVVYDFPLSFSGVK